jgi:N-acetyl-gamma-glutamylphosphate reductase
MIEIARTSDPALRRLLESHPRVNAVEGGPPLGVQFEQGPWRRSIGVGDASADPFGLVELMDNNPMVCADRVSVPSPAGTLALIALGPLTLAGLLLEPATMIVNVEAGEEDVSRSLATASWTEGITLSAAPTDLKGAVAATVIAAIRTPDDLEDIDEAYEERFGRSLYVRRDESSTWDVGLVLGQPHALYRLRISPDEPHSLLTIQLMADQNGKCGAAQVVHAMNVMAGFEESLGI